MKTAEHTKQPDNIYEAYAEGILGDVLFAEHHYKEAAQHYEKALKTYERHAITENGPDSVILVSAMQLASWLSLSNRENIFLTQFACKKALAMTERLLGPDCVDTAASMYNLATANMLLDDVGKGTEGLLARALQIYQTDACKQNDFSLHAAPKKSVNDLMAQMYVRRKDYKAARSAIHRIIDMVNSGFIPGAITIDDHKTLGALYMVTLNRIYRRPCSESS
jgi:tetratricopeptide (TPR) repeat protein